MTKDELQVAYDQLQSQYNELQAKNEQMKTPDGVVETIVALSNADKQKLAHMIRTTNKGIVAYVAMYYGTSISPDSTSSNSPNTGEIVSPTETPRI